MKDLLNKYTATLAQAFKKRTGREKALIVVALIGAFIWGFYAGVFEPVRSAFARQESRLTDLNQSEEVAPDILERYVKLIQKRREIEQWYEKVEIKEPPATYIEGQLRKVFQLPVGSYQVNTRPQGQFAGKYQHFSTNVKFDTNSLAKLVEFLRELIRGTQPMILSQLSIEKRSNGEVLSVQLEVSSFQKITEGQ